MRLNKFLAECGVCSRRRADEIILEGRVSINRKVVSELGVDVNVENDTVFLDGKKIVAVTHYDYLMFNKPKGCVTTMSEENERGSREGDKQAEAERAAAANGRGGLTDKGKSFERNGSADRGGSFERNGSADRGGSFERNGSADRGGSFDRNGSFADRNNSDRNNFDRGGSDRNNSFGRASFSNDKKGTVVDRNGSFADRNKFSVASPNAAGALKPTATANDDKRKRKTVYDYIKTDKRLFPVGRLDFDSEGLLLLTNDGDLTYKLTHPSSEISKTYIVKIEGEIQESDLAILRKGVTFEGVKYGHAKVKVTGIENGLTRIEVTIFEGKNREIRRMFEAVEKKVVFLKRVAIGELRLGGLSRGGNRELTVGEIAYLKKLCEQTPAKINTIPGDED